MPLDVLAATFGGGYRCARWSPSLVDMGDLPQCVALDHPKEYRCLMSSDEEELTNEQAELMALCEQLWLLEKENR